MCSANPAVQGGENLGLMKVFLIFIFFTSCHTTTINFNVFHWIKAALNHAYGLICLLESEVLFSINVFFQDLSVFVIAIYPSFLSCKEKHSHSSSLPSTSTWCTILCWSLHPTPIHWKKRIPLQGTVEGFIMNLNKPQNSPVFCLFFSKISMSLYHSSCFNFRNWPRKTTEMLKSQTTRQRRKKTRMMKKYKRKSTTNKTLKR